MSFHDVQTEELLFADWRLQRRGDEFADICFADRLLLRGIRAVVRDRDWNTLPVTVGRILRSEKGVELSLVFDDGADAFTARLRLTAQTDALQVDFEATAATAAATNRVGLVVLHHPTEAGRPVQVSHHDGPTEDGRWPTGISPHQPFVDVAGFSWTTDGVEAQLSLIGDVFETEDQRNWTDASFKTYSTPLSRPFPVQHRRGDVVSQSARIGAHVRTVQEKAESRPRRPSDLVRVRNAVIGAIPPLSLGAGLYPPPDDLLDWSADSGYHSVLVELNGPAEAWPELLALAEHQATALGCGLDVRIVTDAPDQVVAAIGSWPARVIRAGVFDPATHLTTPQLWQALRDSVGPAVDLVGGSRAHFTELNRGHAHLPDDLPALTFGLTPQMHARELDHIIDSLGMQRLVAESAGRLAAGRPVHVGPITLARRFNAVATTPSPGPDVEAARAVDPLLDTNFAAGWVLASLTALSTAGVASVCCFETAGPRGIRGSAGPKPVGLVLDRFARRRSRPMLEVECGDRLAALAVQEPDGTVQLELADLSGRARVVTVETDTTTVEVELAPWQLSRLDL